MREILIVEDSPEIKILLESTLSDYALHFCSTLKDAKESLELRKFQLIMLDIGLPDGDGLKFLAELSTSPSTKNVPVMILSSKTETSNKIMAFSIGAEDFISKPFDPLELQARVAAKLKKIDRAQSRSEVVRVGDLTIDFIKQKSSLSPDGVNTPPENLDLTTLEFKLLSVFARAPERVFSREQLLNEVWGSEINITDRTVDTHVGHLRKKIVKSKVKIETVVGAGYRLVIRSNQF
jgi:DNA-binding response OmpR family regulator